MNREIEKLHHPQMTAVEEGLKLCLKERKDIHGKVLSGEEMAKYILRMIENYGDKNEKIMNEAIPTMLFGGGIAELGQNILKNSKDKEAKRKLASLYESSQESRFFQELQDISAGKFLRYFPPYWREDDYFEVYYVFSGECPVFFEQESVTLLPGNVLLVPPGTKKACTLLQDDCAVFFFMIRKSTFSQVFWSHLSGNNLMSNFFHEALSGNSNSPYLSFATDCDEWIENLLHRIYAEYNRNEKYSSRLINALMSSFFLSLLQGYEDTARISGRSTFRWKREFAEILDYLQKNYRTATLAELTEKFGYSERQLIRIIQNSTGSSFTKLQTKLRMEEAARMLKTQTVSTEMIAAEIGFTNLSSFYRAFERYYGCTPGQFAKADGIYSSPDSKAFDSFSAFLC